MIETREVKRGQVYWVQQEICDEYETAKFRPAVILTRDNYANTNNVVQVVYLTTQPRTGDMHPDVWSTGKKSWALCDKIDAISKHDLDRYVCTMTEHEMSKMEAAICRVLGMAPATSQLEKQNEQLCEEKALMESELTMWRKLYDKTMEQLVELKYAADVASQSKKKEEMPVVVKKIPRYVPDEPEVDPELEKRKIVPAPIEELKVNVNTAKATEIAEKTGLSLNVAYGITGYRKEHGKFTSISELLNTPRFKESHMKKYGDRLVV